MKVSHCPLCASTSKPSWNLGTATPKKQEGGPLHSGTATFSSSARTSKTKPWILSLWGCSILLPLSEKSEEEKIEQVLTLPYFSFHGWHGGMLVGREKKWQRTAPLVPVLWSHRSSAASQWSPKGPIFLLGTPIPTQTEPYSALLLTQWEVGSVARSSLG